MTTSLLAIALTALLVVGAAAPKPSGRPFPLPPTHSAIAANVELLSADTLSDICGQDKDLLLMRLQDKSIRYNYLFAPGTQIGMFVQYDEQAPIYIWVFHGHADTITITRASTFRALTPAEQTSPCEVLYPLTS